MKKYLALIVLFLILFTPSLRVNAFDNALIETPNDIVKEIPILENGDINESSGFANIVIFIKFADETSYTAPYDYNYYENMFNNETTASLKDYYLEVSYNQLTIESYIVNDGSTMIFYQDTYERAYFEPYDEIENPLGYDGSNGNTQASREHALLKRAIDYVEANEYVSNSIDLDTNEDGDIDSITFMVSGEDSGWNNLFWPHKWSLFTYYNYTLGEYDSDAPMINGKYAYTYTFELLGNSTEYKYQVDVGVIAHETFHLISAPDLYHYYRYDYVEPVGDWGIMDSTSDIPSHMLGYMKEMYGNWIDSVDTITESGTYTLAPLADSGDNLYKIDLGYSNEFLYLEYRVATGTYESNLPGSGLLVYRIDFDYFDDGNVQGYYDEQGNPADELFIFRPGITGFPLPIVFPDEDIDDFDEDGDIDDAALSDSNLHDEMGNGTDIVMFYSDGTLMDVKIYNVYEHDGVITFDIYLPPRIELISEVDIPLGTDLYLYDADGFEYRAEITNIPSNTEVYYTLDGTEPSLNSTLYAGENIIIDVLSNVIKANVYLDGILISVISKEYNFVSEIESDHNPYGNDQNISWYLDLEDDLSAYDLNFHSNSLFEEDYDYLYIIDGLETATYTGAQLSSLTVSYNEDIVIQFYSDEYLDEYYGFYVDVDLLINLQLEVTGQSPMTLEVFDTYIEQGAVITGDNASSYTLVISGTVNTNLLGEYIITYNVIDENLDIVKTSTRVVNVVDTTNPEIVLRGDSIINIEVFGTYSEHGVIVTDNFDLNPNLVISGTVDTDVVGTYIIEYSVTDLSGNQTIETRTVNIVDTTKPTVTILPGIDTLYVGSTHILETIAVSDNYYTVFDITVVGSVDTTKAGQYIIEYTVKDGSLNTITVYRYVTVIEPNLEVIFVLGKAATTIKIGEEFTPPSCSIGGELQDYAYECNVDLTKIDNTISGTYRILYYVEINDVIYSQVSYVFVYNPTDLLVWDYDKSRRGYL